MDFPLSYIAEKVISLNDFSSFSDINTGKKIVFTNGCFDILHFGHLSYLAEASILGDILIVGLNDNDSIGRIKWPTRPINDISSRIFQLASLEYVDYVIVFPENTPENLIRIIQPDVLVKGWDYSIESVIWWDIVKSYGWDVRVLSLYSWYSTSNIENKIRC